MKGLALRKATFEDSKILWEWANDPETRAASFNTQPIEWESHVAWLTQKLADPSCLLLVGTMNGDPVGVVRLDIDGQRAELSITVGRAFRGRGYGRAMVVRAIEEVFSATGTLYVDAFVKPGNVRSISLFVALGFERMGEVVRHGQVAVWFRKRRDGAS